ncbi:MAG: hypothetical protein VKK80_13110 [Prochlorothrix sp.]|nr:hypothetical protein [Prochlorothrix sp.]
MVLCIVAINLGLVLLCLCSVWYLGQIRKTLQELNHSLAELQYHCYRSLHLSPPSTTAGQRGTQNLRHQYRHLEASLIRLQRFRALVQLLQRLDLMQNLIPRRFF